MKIGSREVAAAKQLFAAAGSSCYSVAGPSCSSSSLASARTHSIAAAQAQCFSQGRRESLCGRSLAAKAHESGFCRSFTTSSRRDNLKTPPPPPPGGSSSSGSSGSGSSSSSQQADDFDSLYSSRYHGQGAKSTRPAWYKSPVMLLLGFMPIFTLGLGVWQIQRLDWKLGLIEELEYKLKKDPIELPRNVNLSVLPSFEFRLVPLSGRFDHSRTMFLGPRVREGVMGYHVVVPLIRDGGGGEVMVDRGFVSEKAIIVEGGRRRLRDGEAISPTGNVTLTTLLPRISPPNYFTPPNEPQNNRWFHADPGAMADWASTGSSRGALPLGGGDEEEEQDAYTPSAGVGSSVKKMLGLRGGVQREEHRVLPILLEEIFEGYDGNLRVEKGIPVGRAATIELRNQHAVYAATWFSLSAATAAMFTILVRRK